jgi:hypothetical protein
MSTNKRINNPRAKSAKDMLSEGKGRSVKPKSLKAKAEDLEKTLHRLEVEIAATSRLAHEKKIKNRNFVPPPERSGFARSAGRKTHAQKLEQRRKLLIQVAEFSFTALLFVGACAWLYQWWLSRGGQ